MKYHSSLAKVALFTCSHILAILIGMGIFQLLYVEENEEIRETPPVALLPSDDAQIASEPESAIRSCEVSERFERLLNMGSPKEWALEIESRLLRGRDASIELAIFAEKSADTDPEAFMRYALEDGIVSRESMLIFIRQYLESRGEGASGELGEMLRNHPELLKDQELLRGTFQALIQHGIEPHEAFGENALNERVVEKGTVLAQMDEQGFETAQETGVEMSKVTGNMIQHSAAFSIVNDQVTGMPSSALKEMLSQPYEHNVVSTSKRDPMISALISRDAEGALHWFVEKEQGAAVMSAMKEFSNQEIDASLEFLRTTDSVHPDVINNLLGGIIQGAGREDTTPKDEANAILRERGIEEIHLHP